MQILVGGEPVVHRNWTDYLVHGCDAKPWHPRVDVRSNGGERALAEVSFGYAMQMRELTTTLQHLGGGKDAQRRKWEATEYSGVFYYHRGRLLIPLQRLPCRDIAGNQMMTTERRIRTGAGLLAVCRENYLTPSHNKRSYVLRETLDSTAPRPEALFKKVADEAVVHLSTFVTPLLDRALGKVAPQKQRRETAAKRKGGSAVSGAASFLCTSGTSTWSRARAAD